MLWNVGEITRSFSGLAVDPRMFTCTAPCFCSTEAAHAETHSTLLCRTSRGIQGRRQATRRNLLRNVSLSASCSCLATYQPFPSRPLKRRTKQSFEVFQSSSPRPSKSSFFRIPGPPEGTRSAAAAAGLQTWSAPKQSLEPESVTSKPTKRQT